ncbi:hypothetical protein, partial [Bacillus paralicheniformis]|uniref:hypothetical protein n=1 Tax=Bacillus paralicheniformis TaxID=1648923 RepID=UPI0028526C14
KCMLPDFSKKDGINHVGICFRLVLVNNMINAVFRFLLEEAVDFLCGPILIIMMLIGNVTVFDRVLIAYFQLPFGP